MNLITGLIKNLSDRDHLYFIEELTDSSEMLKDMPKSPP